MSSNSFRFLIVIPALMVCGSPLPNRAAERLGPAEIVQFLDQVRPKDQSRAAVGARQVPRVSLTTNGFLRYVGAPVQEHFAPAGGRPETPEVVASAFMVKNRRLFGVDGTNSDFVVKRKKTRGGRNFIRLQQTWRNIPIVDGEVQVQVDDLGGVEAVISDLAVGIDSLDASGFQTAPALTAGEAAARARAIFARDVNPGEITASDPQLELFVPAVMDMPGEPVLVWDLTLSCDSLLDANAEVLVDAQTGGIVRRWTLVYSALSRQIYEANLSTNDPGTLALSEGQAVTGNFDVTNAYIFLGDTYNFYFTKHGRDSLDNTGMVLSATVHYCGPNGVNPPFCPPKGLAFYSANKSRMYFGSNYVADDITAHELTHGVTAYESKLKYENASGAINESFSDVWGEFVDLSNTSGNDVPTNRWKIGEDMPGGPIRSMKSPELFGDADRLSSTNYRPAVLNPDPDTNDNGGVHHNSGVNNKLCYLLTDGDTFNGQTVRGLGITKVAELYYEVQADGMLFPSSGWDQLYNALQQAAVILGWSVADQNNLFRACLAVEIATPGMEFFVNLNASCPFPDGSPICGSGYGPFQNISQAVAAVHPGDALRIESGVYAFAIPVTEQKYLTLRTNNGPVTLIKP